ncbi:MAG: HAMP domain-containing protein [Comamonadaceae bacterium]|nr:MAG: HAMP domain-containing protein [Comamonadaceae bacterium]
MAAMPRRGSTCISSSWWCRRARWRLKPSMRRARRRPRLPRCTAATWARKTRTRSRPRARPSRRSRRATWGKTWRAAGAPPARHRMTLAEASVHRPLATKIGAIGCLLLALALGAIGLTLWVTWQLEGGAAAVNEAGRMRMQAWRLAQTLSAGDQPLLAPRLAELDQSMRLLEQGNAERPLAVPREKASRDALAKTQRNWQQLRQRWQGGGVRAAEAAVDARAFVATIDGFVSTIERQLARWTTLLNTAQFAMMALAIAAALALLYAAQLLVFGPLVRLQAGLARVEAGDLSARVDATGNDEFGAVAQGFNRMATRLEDLYASLARRVEEKTEHLETERARLAALYEAAASAARADSLTTLAQAFAVHTRRVAGADACAVRWSDEQNRRYVLLGSDQLPPALAEAEHCVPTGDCFCGQPQQGAQTQVFALRDLRGPGGLVSSRGLRRIDAGEDLCC